MPDVPRRRKDMMAWPRRVRMPPPVVMGLGLTRAEADGRETQRTGECDPSGNRFQCFSAHRELQSAGYLDGMGGWGLAHM